MPAGLFSETRQRVTIIQSLMGTLTEPAAHDAISPAHVLPAPQNPTSAQSADHWAARRAVVLLLLAGLIAVAAVVRFIPIHNELWLDELVSLHMATTVKTPWQIFTTIHKDNNHYLNTLYLYVVKNQKPPAAYRYLALLWGILLVPAGYWFLARRSRVDGALLAVLLAFSYPLIHFSAEARGYTGALLGSTLAAGALARWMSEENSKSRSFFLAMIYAAGLILAILSHLTSVLICFPLAAGSLVILLERRQRIRWAARWFAINALPGAVFAAIYFFDLRFLIEMGGEPMTVSHGLSRLLALSLGWPGTGTRTIWILAAPLLGLLAWRLARERKSGEPLWLALVLIYAMPAVCMLVLKPGFFAPRYFVIVLPFLYAGIAMLLSGLSGNPGRRIALAAVLALFVAGQGRLYARFLRVGQGQFTAALGYMIAHTPSARLTVTSNQDFRSTTELSYYAPRLLKHQQLLYVPQGVNSVQPEWYILHEEGSQPPGPATLSVEGQPTWFRAAYFGSAELSGQAFTIYSHHSVN